MLHDRVFVYQAEAQSHALFEQYVAYVVCGRNHYSVCNSRVVRAKKNPHHTAGAV